MSTCCRRMPKFTVEESRFRRKWFDLVETQDQWKELDRIGAVKGESDPIRVENCRTGRMGVAKPGPVKAHQDYFCRAAHEKLAYDLAYLIELPVSPVVLWQEGAPDPYKRGRSISAWAFEQSLTWKAADASGFITPAQTEAARSIISAMRAFHIWIGDLDRDTHQISIDLAAGTGELRVSFYDHSSSMSYIWSTDDAETQTLPTYFPLPDLREIMLETADRIAALPESQIRDLAMRIKEPYLPDEIRHRILSNLLRRKARLREILTAAHRTEDRRRNG
jgi:hypothetical protein